MAREIWQQNYLSGRYNKWPYDAIITLSSRAFGQAEDLSAIRLLDLGCGGGNNSLFLQSRGFDFRAVDAAPEAVRLTKELLGLDENDDRVVVSDFVDLPFSDSEFDGVIDRASLCCNLSNDFLVALSEVKRVLKPGGALVSVNLYGLKTDDLRFGDDIGNGDYNNFTDGIFVHSQEVHAFSIDQIHEYFNGFEIEYLERNMAQDCLSAKGEGKRETFNLIARRN